MNVALNYWWIHQQLTADNGGGREDQPRTEREPAAEVRKPKTGKSDRRGKGKAS